MAKSTFIRESPCKGGRNAILVAAGCKVGAAWLWWTHPAADKKLLSLSSANILFILNRTVSSASGGICLGDSSLGIGRPVNTYTLKRWEHRLNQTSWNGIIFCKWKHVRMHHRLKWQGEKFQSAKIFLKILKILYLKMSHWKRRN